MKDVIIIGGGLGGLVTALDLTSAGIKVCLFEKKNYPFHRVCGEYISNEAIPYLKSLNINFDELSPSQISRFLLSSPSGKTLQTTLDLGGFGISRYSLDYYLYKKCLEAGVEVCTGKEVKQVEKKENHFEVTTSEGIQFTANVVIGAFGKRSKLDKALNRSFIEKRSPYVGVKYHIKTDLSADLIALHNFKDGYCGVSKVEGETYNLCYLSHRKNLKTYKNIQEVEEHILFKNPYLKDLFTNSDFLFEKPEVINEISFEKKEVVENHILMVGDAAGMITPLCGNGMAMAIHGAKILARSVKDYFTHKNREILEKNYSQEWNRNFNKRLLIGRTIQRLFGKELLTELMVGLFKSSTPLSNFVIKKTHGKEF